MQNDGTEEIYSADKFVIATGSRPYRPSDVDFLHERIYDSDSILSLETRPSSYHHLWCRCYRL